MEAVLERVGLFFVVFVTMNTKQLRHIHTHHVSMLRNAPRFDITPSQCKYAALKADSGL